MRLITPAETMLGHLGSLSVYKDVALELRDNSPRINHLPQSAWHRIFASIRHVFWNNNKRRESFSRISG
jgi:hypothetical protein